MDYTTLVKALRGAYTFPMDTRRICLEAADAIEALQRACANYAEQACENETKWIPVKERLPRADRAEQVLINLHYPDGSNEVSLGEHWNCPDIPEEDGWGGFGGNGVVTHWQPLPTPPKEETE